MIKNKLLVLALILLLKIKSNFLIIITNQDLENNLCIISDKICNIKNKNDTIICDYKCNKNYFRCGYKHCAIKKKVCNFFLLNVWKNESFFSINKLSTCYINLKSVLIHDDYNDLEQNLCIISEKICKKNNFCDYKCKNGYFRCGLNHCSKQKKACKYFLNNKTAFSLNKFTTCSIDKSGLIQINENKLEKMNISSISITLNSNHYVLLIFFFLLLFLFIYFVETSTVKN